MSRRRSLDQLEKLPIILGRDSVHIGHFRGTSDYVVHGRVEGDGDIDGTLMIGPDGLWVGNVTADNVIIKGRVDGHIHARFKLELRPSARVKGNLSSPLIAIAEGAVVQGQISPDSVLTRFRERRSH